MGAIRRSLVKRWKLKRFPVTSSDLTSLRETGPPPATSSPFATLCPVRQSWRTGSRHPRSEPRLGGVRNKPIPPLSPFREACPSLPCPALPRGHQRLVKVAVGEGGTTPSPPVFKGLLFKPSARLRLFALLQKSVVVRPLWVCSAIFFEMEQLRKLHCAENELCTKRFRNAECKVGRPSQSWKEGIVHRWDCNPTLTLATIKQAEFTQVIGGEGGGGLKAGVVVALLLH